MPWGLNIDGNDDVWIGNFGPRNFGVVLMAGAAAKGHPAGTKPGDVLHVFRSGSIQMLTDVNIDPARSVWAANNWNDPRAAVEPNPESRTSTWAGGSEPAGDCPDFSVPGTRRGLSQFRAQAPLPQWSPRMVGPVRRAPTAGWSGLSPSPRRVLHIGTVPFSEAGSPPKDCSNFPAGGHRCRSGPPRWSGRIYGAAAPVKPPRMGKVQGY